MLKLFWVSYTLAMFWGALEVGCWALGIVALR
jgi:hypothetical protein